MKEKHNKKINIFEKSIISPKKIILCCLVVLSILLSGCLSREIVDISSGEEEKAIVIGLMSDTLGFHPWIESYDIETMSVNANIFNSLVEFDEDFRIKTSLATSWNNPDNLTWRFKLKEGVTFQNGYDFSAEDVKYSFDIILDDDESVLRDLLTTVSEVKIVDNLTIDIITNNPNPTFLNKLVDIFIVSKKYQEETSEKWPIGTGGYILKEYVKNDYILLEQFEDYWKKDPEVKKITFKIYGDHEIRKEAFVEKELDICGVHFDHYDELLNLSYIDIQLISSPTVMYLAYDLREYGSVGYGSEKNPVSDVKVRQAMYHAIDIESIIENIFNGFGVPASQFVSPLIFGYNPDIERSDFDLDEATNLMIEAGYENGFEMDMDCTDDNTTIELCEEFKNQLSKINITLNLVLNTVEEFYQKIDSRNSQFYFIGWLTGTADGGEIYDFLLRSYDEENSTGLYNCGYYCNSEVDEIADEINTIMDPEKRLKKLQEGFAIAMNDVAWIPLYIPQSKFGSLDTIDLNPRADLAYRIEDIGFV